MRLLRNLSIGRKFTLITMLVSCGALLLACAAFAIYEQTAFRHSMARDFAIIADMFDDNVAPGLAFNDSSSMAQTVATLRAHRHILAAGVYDKSGELVAHYQRDGLGGEFAFPEAQAAGQRFGESRLDTFQDITLAGENIGVVYIGSDLDELGERASRYTLMVGTLLLVCSALALLLTGRLQKIISQPIVELAKTAAAVAMGKDYSVRAVKQSNDEVGALIDGFNDMLAQIQARDAKLQQAYEHLEKRVAERTAELAHSLSLLNATLEATTDGVLAIDLRGQVVCSNSKVARIWALPPGKAIDPDSEKLIAYSAQQARDPQQFIDRMRVLQSDREKEAFDLLELKDGRWVERYVLPQMVGHKCVGVVVSFRDITERKRAEAELAYERELLRGLLTASPDAIYFKDRQSRFLRCSAIMAQTLNGSSPDQLIGRSDFEFFAEEFAQSAFDDERRIMSTGEPVTAKTERAVWPDGRITWSLTSKMPLRNVQGEIIGTIGTSKDITPLKEAEATLAYERDLLRALLNSGPDAIYFKDRASRFIRTSQAHARQLKLASADAVVGKKDSDFFTPEHAEPALQDEQRIILTGEPLIDKIEKETWSDGRVTWALTSKMPFRDVSGSIIGTFGVSKDITRMKETEERLQRVHEELLETSRRAGMAEVATGVLHNVGNVLNSINVSTTIVANQTRQSDADHLAKVCALLRSHEAELGPFFNTHPKGRQILGFLETLAAHRAAERATVGKEVESLRKNVDHIKEIVAMQQSYARVSGVAEIIPVTELVEDALRMNGGALVRHDVTLVRDFQATPTIAVEKHKVLQILVNLIRNAKYACDDSPRADKRLTVRITEDADSVRIAVIDNGVGIPAENLSRIFNHGFTTRKTGHGFGLHSGALAAKELGGSLGVESDGPGCGAAFTLVLPHQRESAVA